MLLRSVAALAFCVSLLVVAGQCLPSFPEDFIGTVHVYSSNELTSTLKLYYAWSQERTRHDQVDPNNGIVYSNICRGDLNPPILYEVAIEGSEILCNYYLGCVPSRYWDFPKTASFEGKARVNGTLMDVWYFVQSGNEFILYSQNVSSTVAVPYALLNQSEDLRYQYDVTPTLPPLGDFEPPVGIPCVQQDAA